MSIGRIWAAAIAAAGVMSCASAAGAAAPSPAPTAAPAAAPKLVRAAVSPSGAHVALISDRQGEFSFVIRANGGAMEMAKPLGKVRPLSVYWVDDDHLLVFVAKTDGDLPYVQEVESSLVYIVNLKSKKVAYLRRDLQGFAGGFSAGGRAYGYFYEIYESPSGSIRQYAAGSLTQVDLDGGPERIAGFASTHVRRSWISSPRDGAIVAETDYDPQSKRWAVYAGKAHELKLCEIVVEPKHTASLEGEGRTQGTVLVRENIADASQWFEIDTRTGEKTELFAGEQVDKPVFDSKTGLLIGAIFGNERRMRLLDPALQAKLDRARASAGASAQIIVAGGGLDWVLAQIPGSGGSDQWRVVNTTTGASWILDPGAN